MEEPVHLDGRLCWRDPPSRRAQVAALVLALVLLGLVLVLVLGGTTALSAWMGLALLSLPVLALFLAGFGRTEHALQVAEGRLSSTERLGPLTLRSRVVELGPITGLELRAVELGRGQVFLVRARGRQSADLVVLPQRAEAEGWARKASEILGLGGFGLAGPPASAPGRPSETHEHGG